MSDELEQFEKALMSKDEKTLVSLTTKHTNEERVKLRADYQAKFGRDLLKDFDSKLGSDFKNCMVGLYKPADEYNADLLYYAMKGIGSNKEVISEVLSFGSADDIKAMKAKFQEKYKNDLVAEVKSETSGDYQKIVLALLDGNRGTNSSPDVQSCANIAKEIFELGDGKGDLSVFVKYFPTLSKDELLIVCKEYHKNHNKNILDTIDKKFSGNERDLLKIILYAMYSPAEYFAKVIHSAVAGAGTSDDKLIRCFISRAEKDMPKIKKYYKKLYNVEMEEDIKGDLSGNYLDTILELMK